jgi:hypothetical protein
MKSYVGYALAGCGLVSLAVVAAVAQEGGKTEFRSMAELDAH